MLAVLDEEYILHMSPILPVLSTEIKVSMFSLHCSTVFHYPFITMQDTNMP